MILQIIEVTYTYFTVITTFVLMFATSFHSHAYQTKDQFQAYFFMLTLTELPDVLLPFLRCANTPKNMVKEAMEDLRLQT